MKRLIPVAVLFAVLAALVAAREVRRGSLDAGGVPAGEFVPLAATKFEAKNAEKIEVTAPGGSEPAFVLERDGGSWVMTKPFRAPAHQNHANELCDALATGDAEPRADDAGTLRDTDLTPERASAVRVTDAAGKVLAHVAIGRSTDPRGAFLRFLGDPADQRCFATTARLREALGLGRTWSQDAAPETPGAAHFRDRDFPLVKTDTAKRVEIAIPGRRVVFEKSGDAWIVAEGGPGFGIAKNAVENVLRKLGPDFKAKDLADPSDLGKLGLADPRWILAVTLEDGTVQRVFGGADVAAGRYHLRLDQTAGDAEPAAIYEANAWDFQAVFPAGSSLFTFPACEIENESLLQVAVEKAAQAGRPATRIRIARTGTQPADEWKVAEPDLPLAPKNASLQSLASAVRSVRATDWVDAADLGAAELTVRLGRESDLADDEKAIVIGGKTPWGKDRLCVLPNTPGKVLVIADSTADRIDVAPTSLFEPKVLHAWSEPDVKAVRVAGASGAWSVERGDKGWTLVRGEERTDASATAVRAWIAALLALETREAEAAPAESDATIEVEKADGTKRVLALGPAKDGKRGVTVGSLSFSTDRTDLLPAAESLAAPPPKAPEAPAPPPVKDGDPPPPKENGAAPEER